MNRTCLVLSWGLLITSGAITVHGAEQDQRLFEMRTYYAAPGKLDALEARFRDHTTKLFEKHGMTNVGYFVPLENPDQRLIYFLAYPNREAREKAWQAFLKDPDWTAAKAKSEENGPLITKVEAIFLTATDYSPSIKPAAPGNRIFELRTYTTTPGNLPNLHARFRDHTCELFRKHGMTNVAYWQLEKGQPGADDTLVYILAHQSVDAAKASFGAFRSDPDWVAARQASEAKAGGSLTVPDGVKSLFMKATDYSTIR